MRLATSTPLSPQKTMDLSCDDGSRSSKLSILADSKCFIAVETKFLLHGTKTSNPLINFNHKIFQEFLSEVQGTKIDTK